MGVLLLLLLSGALVESVRASDQRLFLPEGAIESGIVLMRLFCDDCGLLRDDVSCFGLPCCKFEGEAARWGLRGAGCGRCNLELS